MTSRILPVSMLNAYIQQVVTADEILADVWIEGEISRLTRARSGHLYFGLWENGALIDCVMWRTAAAHQTFIPDVGDDVIIHGRTDFYPPQGRLQVIADVFEHQGQGILALEMERLRQRLEAEGLFDPTRKRPLPLFPRRVGVVTSSTGAVWHDIQTVARRRYPLVELVLIPAAVQGSHASREIVSAIRQMGDLGEVDVIIVGRGGGSPEDLVCFNAEEVARAIFASTVPIVSAVGHETDVTIADMVADVRAATPSAAAEIILPDIQDIRTALADSRTDLVQMMERYIAGQRIRVSHLQRRFHQQSPVAQVSRARQNLDILTRRALAAAQLRIDRHDVWLRSTAKILAVLHPKAALQRGYTRLESPDERRPFHRVAELDGPTDVVVTFYDGVARGTIAAIPPQQREDAEG